VKIKLSVLFIILIFLLIIIL